MNAKFFEYDVVKTNSPLAENVPVGTAGAVLMVFDTEPVAYEVEFVDDVGESLAVLTVKEEELELIQHVN